MFHLLLAIVAVFAVFGVPSPESLTSSAPMTDYLAAIVVALMLKPWLEYHLD